MATDGYVGSIHDSNFDRTLCLLSGLNSYDNGELWFHGERHAWALLCKMCASDRADGAQRQRMAFTAFALKWIFHLHHERLA